MKLKLSYLFGAIVASLFLFGCATYSTSAVDKKWAAGERVWMSELDPLVSRRHQQNAFIEFKDRVEIPMIMGAYEPIINPKPTGNRDKWFTNDHNFIVDKRGELHWFGIANPYPPVGKELYRYHPYLGHFSTSTEMDDSAPFGKWKMHPWAINEIEGSEYVGAPFVVWHEASGRYAMVVETLINRIRRLEVCWSDDLVKWERTLTPILPDELWISSRDPQIIARADGSYWIIVVSHGIEGKNRSQIIRFETRDFVHFSDPVEILGIDDNNFATLMESPFIVERGDLWYLFFTYAHKKYAETIVVVSDNPDYFDYHKNTVTTLFSHAAEIFNYNGVEYISTCGPEDFAFLNRHYCEIAPLKWHKFSK